MLLEITLHLGRTSGVPPPTRMSHTCHVVRSLLRHPQVHCSFSVFFSSFIEVFLFSFLHLSSFFEILHFFFSFQFRVRTSPAETVASAAAPPHHRSRRRTAPVDRSRRRSAQNFDLLHLSRRKFRSSVWGLPVKPHKTHTIKNTHRKNPHTENVKRSLSSDLNQTKRIRVMNQERKRYQHFFLEGV